MHGAGGGVPRPTAPLPRKRETAVGFSKAAQWRPESGPRVPGELRGARAASCAAVNGAERARGPHPGVGRHLEGRPPLGTSPTPALRPASPSRPHSPPPPLSTHRQARCHPEEPASVPSAPGGRRLPDIRAPPRPGCARRPQN